VSHERGDPPQAASRRRSTAVVGGGGTPGQLGQQQSCTKASSSLEYLSPLDEDAIAGILSHNVYRVERTCKQRDYPVRAAANLM